MRVRMKKGTGRPREYDPELALQAATKLLWNNGLSNSSLDEIAHSAEMNRPSLNAAFGGKRDIYLKAAQRFGDAMGARLTDALAEPRLLDALQAAFRTAVETYAPGDDLYGGCFVICTAPAEVADPEVRDLLAQAIKSIDDLFLRRLEKARDDGELAKDTPLAPLSNFLAASLHSLALRARAGANDRALKAYAKGVVEVMRLSVR